MTDTKIPQPALFSETLEKARRNTLVWSALAIAAELAQGKDHTIKSSILGGDTGLPVAMVGFVFLFLSAFHFAAFWFEKTRIERWRSQYASEHIGIDLNERINALFSRLENQFVEVDQAYRNWVLQLRDLDSSFEKATENLYSISSALADLHSKNRELFSRLGGRSIDNETLRSEMAHIAIKTNPSLVNLAEFNAIHERIEAMKLAANTRTGLTVSYRSSLEALTTKLSRLSDDISTSEVTYFRWYEVAMPVVALLGAAALWVSATIWPDLPLAIRAAFIRS